MAELTITSDNFMEEVVNYKGTVLLDFWATWCGPCRMLGPVIEQIAQERQDIKVGKVNVDEQTELQQQFEVMSIPMIVLIKDGQIVKTHTGFMPKEAILDWIG